MIGTKQLNIVFAILLAAVIATAATAYYAVSRIDDLVNRINTTSEKIDALSSIQPTLRNTLLVFMSSSGSEVATQAVIHLENVFNQQFDRLEQLSPAESERQSLSEIKEISTSLVQTLRNIINGNPNAFTILENQRDQLENITKELIDALRMQNIETLNDIETLRNRFTIISISIVAIALIAFFFIALPAIYSIGSRIENLNQSLAAIGRGVMGIRIAPKGNDALTSIEETMNNMSEQLQQIDVQRSDKANYLESEVARRSADLAAANSRLRTIDENRKAFIVELAHALKTPLAVARASVENTANSADGLNEAALTRSLSAIDDVIQKTQELLRLAQREDGLIGAAFEDVELYELLDNRVASFNRLKNIARIELHYAGDEPLIIFGQSNELSRLFDAIIENATQHTEANDVITVELQNLKDEVEISITDNGTGIESAEREHVFERFVTNRPDGTGIGLAMARRIATEHGGTIEIDAARTGGTTVRVRLPKKKEVIKLSSATP